MIPPGHRSPGSRVGRGCDSDTGMPPGSVRLWTRIIMTRLMMIMAPAARSLVTVTAARPGAAGLESRRRVKCPSRLARACKYGHSPGPGAARGHWPGVTDTVTARALPVCLSAVAGNRGSSSQVGNSVSAGAGRVRPSCHSLVVIPAEAAAARPPRARRPAGHTEVLARPRSRT